MENINVAGSLKVQPAKFLRNFDTQKEKLDKMFVAAFGEMPTI